jgi:hypothetical protein
MILALLAVAAGCSGSDRATVTGRATHKGGGPLVGARIIARSDATGKSATATTHPDGTYQLGTHETPDSILPGDYNVMVVEDTGDSNAQKPQTIANKYKDPDRSQLKFSVKAGEHAVLDMTLDAK